MTLQRVLGIQTHAWAFYKESSTSTSSQLGQVKKISETKANITIENSAAASYTAEGNMTDLTYTIKMGTKIVAAVCLASTPSINDQSGLSVQRQQGKSCPTYSKLSACDHALDVMELVLW